MKRALSLAIAVATLSAAQLASSHAVVICEDSKVQLARKLTEAKLIFLGRLVSEVAAPSNPSAKVITMAVLRRWKGPSIETTVELSWPEGHPPIISGHSFLIIAESGPNATWTVPWSKCFHGVIAEPDADVAFTLLGAPEWTLDVSGSK